MSRQDRFERLLAAVDNEDVDEVRRLADEYRSVPLTVGDLDDPLSRAVQKEYCDVVEALLMRGRADVNRTFDGGRRIIHVAAEVGNVMILRMVISAGSPVNPVDRNGISPLHVCIEHGHREAAVVLINAGAMVNRPRRYDNGEGPVHCAARHGMSDLLRFIIRKGGYLEQRSADGSTPLHLAVREKHAGCTELLCVAGASVNSSDARGMTPFILAVQQVQQILQRYTPGCHNDICM